MIWIIMAFGANFISCWIRIRIRNADPDPGGKFHPDPKHCPQISLLKWFFSRFSDTKEPYRCCGRETCVSLTPQVDKLLDPDVVEIQLAHRYSDLQDQNQLLPQNYRFVSYRNLFFFIYGRTKVRMSRLPLPSCLVMKVRAAYPDPKNIYTGFKAKRMRK